MTEQKILSGGPTILKIVFLFSFLIIGAGLARPVEAQTSLPQPYFLFPNAANYQTGSSWPIITGETQNNTAIEVYLDDQLAGQAAVINGPLLTAYFTFRPTKNLAGGEHKIYVIAKDKNNPLLTSRSAAMNLYIWPFPQPTLFPITQHRNGQPIIQGVAKNDSLIKIFADGQLQATFPVANHPSGTTAFSWVALLGKSFSATATDPEGKASALSNLVSPGQPAAVKPAPATAEPKPAITPEPAPEKPAEVATPEESAGLINKPATGAKIFSQKSFWLWALLVVIVMMIIFWLRKNLKAKPSGEIISQEIKPTTEENPPTTKPEPQLNLPIEPTKTEGQPPTTEPKNQPPANQSPTSPPSGSLDNF